MSDEEIVSVRLSKEIIKGLEELSKELGVNKSSTIRLLLKQKLTELGILKSNFKIF